jgi:hypothetical protein
MNMTPAQLDALSERELDALVAEKIMGWKKTEASFFLGDWWADGNHRELYT